MTFERDTRGRRAIGALDLASEPVVAASVTAAAPSDVGLTGDGIRLGLSGPDSGVLKILPGASLRGEGPGEFVICDSVDSRLLPVLRVFARDDAVGACSRDIEDGMPVPVLGLREPMDDTFFVSEEWTPIELAADIDEGRAVLPFEPAEGIALGRVL